VTKQSIWMALSTLLLLPVASLATEINYGGHLKYFLTYSDFPDKSVFAGDDNPYTEHLGNLRLKLETRDAHWSGEIHYVMDALYSKNLASCQLRGALTAGGCDNLGSDAKQLFDLSTSTTIGDDALLVQRLDRLWLGYSTDKVVARFGRQTISWGNGMVYNTFDLFNPFAPDAIFIPRACSMTAATCRHCSSRGGTSQRVTLKASPPPWLPKCTG